jgi:hypothetical protein
MFNIKYTFLTLFIFLFIFSCSTQSDKDKIVFNFTDGMDGWLSGVSGKSLDSVTWLDWAGVPAGCIKLDGSDFGASDHMANSWIYKEIEIPASAKTLRFLTSAHDRDNANAELRVSLIDESQSLRILLDWELANDGTENKLDWISRSVSIEPWAGRTVTLYFEQGDNDIGVHEQRYIDKIEIR